MSRTRFLLRFPLRLLAAPTLTLLTLLSSPAPAQEIVRVVPLPRVSPANLKAALVESVAIGARVVGHIASTQVDIVLRNPNASAIESAVQFPLREGQTVTRFALQSVDHSRFLFAAPVEKARGQEVFEQVVRESADPALLEKTAGNNFRLRVYPIAPGETRTVRLDISEFLLPGPAGRLQYQMPQMLKEARPQQFSFHLELDGVTQSSVNLSEGLKKAQVSQSNGSARLRFNTTEKLGNFDYTVGWAARDRVFTDYGSMDDETYFNAQLPLKLPSSPRRPPKVITLIWDASGSGSARDHGREFAFLDAVFKSLGSVKVQLVETHVLAEPPRPFEISHGRWDALRAALENMHYDGASNPNAWSTTAKPTRTDTQGDLTGTTDFTLVFSDGIGNWGSPQATASHGTLFTVNASAGANTGVLRALSEPGGGQMIDLMQLPVAQAVGALMQVRARVLRMSGDGVDQLVSPSPYAQAGVLQIAGHMTRERASVTLDIALPTGGTERRQLDLKSELRVAPTATSSAAQRWAALRIAQLETNGRLHEAEITRLGSEFGVVSSRTSLIVLERLEDYLRFDVMPSDPLWRTQFRQATVRKAARQAAEQSQHVADLLKRFNERSAWWEKTYPKGALVRKPEPANAPPVAMAVAPMAMAPAPAAAPTALHNSESSSAAAQLRMRNEASERRRSEFAPGMAPPSELRELGISVQKQQLNSAYAVRLRNAAANDRFAVYLDEKTAHAKSSAFFLDASEIFFEQGQAQIGLRVLSNLAEMELEDRALLRTLAYRLQQAKLYEQAILLFRQVSVLAPNEPQSWRDLGLAHADNGDAQGAVDALWHVASQQWNSRFADIDLIALGELNAIVAQNTGLDLSRVDPHLLRSLPVDLRVVMAWDADNTDIDLWVKDPNGEDAYYGHQDTYQGGRVSRDFTGGYGPEEYMVRVAKPGRYEVRAQYYGSRQQRHSPYTTVMLRFVTGYGSPNEKSQSVIMRLPESGSEVLVGSFEVKAR